MEHGSSLGDYMALYIVNSLDGFGAFTATVSETNGIDAGQFVKCVSTVEATATSTVVDKILVSMCDDAADEDVVVGVALEDADNGEVISIATRGIFRFQSEQNNGAITAGAVLQVGDQAVSGAGATTDGIEVELYAPADGARPIGQALTTSNADDEFVVCRMSMGNGGGAI
jgi:predicted RecA/RadA family phage recombinase